MSPVDDKATVERDAQRVAADRAAEDKANAAKAGAVEASTSVAEAVKRVADAAVAEVQKSKVQSAPGDFIFRGSPGGRFTIDGPAATFSTNGTVKLNGVQLNTRAWSSMRIEGDLPADAKTGAVTVEIDEKTKFTGRFVR